MRWRHGDGWPVLHKAQLDLLSTLVEKECTLEEAAKHLGCTHGAVRSQVNRINEHFDCQRIYQSLVKWMKTR